MVRRLLTLALALALILATVAPPLAAASAGRTARGHGTPRRAAAHPRRMRHRRPHLALHRSPSGAGATTAPALPWIEVAHPPGRRAQLVDPEGRTVILRGVNLAGIADDYYTTDSGAEPGPAPIYPVDPAAYRGRCPAMSHHAGEPPACEVQAGGPRYAQSSSPGSQDDLAQMRALGIDVIRLTLSWSLLEPTPGVYDQRYVDRIAQVVGWAREQGIHVLLDMHQDAYSRFTPDSAPVSAPPLVEPSTESSAHADGAPPWAVLAGSAPALAAGGVPELNLYVESAFASFWANTVPAGVPQGQAPGPGLQDHYIGAMATLARRFEGDSTVLGYEIMNEPLPGTTPPGAFSNSQLYPFYRRVIDALTGVHDGAACPAGAPSDPSCGYPDLGVHVHRQSFFFEPLATRNVTDAPEAAAVAFSSYPDLVYAPHTYTHVFTADAEAGVPSSPYPLSYDQAYEVADSEARTFGAALFSGEYGNSAAQDDTILRNETAAQDRALVGSTIYAWKGVCTGATQAGCDAGAWSFYSADAATPPAENRGLIPSRVKFLSRVYPRATAGTLTGMAYDPDRRSFSMSARDAPAVRAGDRTHETEVFIPATVHGGVAVGGAARLDAVIGEPDGTRLAYAAPTGPGEYTVSVRPD